jgi:F420-dependent methylenetetrahydromethanopterin dehydrogenase
MIPVSFINLNTKKPAKVVNSAKAWEIEENEEDKELGFTLIDQEQFLALTIGELLSPTFRFVVRVIKDNHVFRVVSHDQDYQQILDKHPKDVTLKLSQIMYIFSSKLEPINFDKVFLACESLDAKIVADPFKF